MKAEILIRCGICQYERWIILPAIINNISCPNDTEHKRIVIVGAKLEDKV